MCVIKISVLSCGGSNVSSVVNALYKIGYKPLVLTEPDHKTDFLVIPGVGTFGTAMRRLRNTGLSEYIKEHVAEGRPAIGICLGMQILFETSEEDSMTAGLSILKGNFQKLHKQSSPNLRSPPNIGYNFVEFTTGEKERFVGQAFTHINGYYYFIHSFALKGRLPAADILGTSRFNDETIISFVLNDNLCGIQFHPERSGPQGLNLLAHTINVLK